MLNLAHLLCLSQLDITFIVSDFCHRRLLKNSAITSTFSLYPGFHFRPISDGLPDDHPRAGEKAIDILHLVTNTMMTHFEKTIIREGFFASATRRPVTCIIADGVLASTCDFAEEHGIPLIYFRTPSASSFWTFFRLIELFESKEIPFRGDEMDEIVKSVPGMEGFLRRRDLPSFCRVDDVNDPILQTLASITRKTVRAQAAIFNTFEELEGPIASQIRKHMPRIYTIGPIHTHLKSRLLEKNAQASILSGGFWAEDRSCMDWLNAQPPKSVIYVSFGSIAVVTREQLLEFWHGLVSSGQRFLWVVRPDFAKGEDGENEIPAQLAEGTKERGCLVGWAPQEEVLNHRAVGGFLTHSGWNSTLESLGAGVPMICWPYFADQMVNSRLVGEVWRIGLDIKDTCDRRIIETAVREIMEIRNEEFLGRADRMAKLAEEAVSKGGSSCSNLDGLIEYINSLII